MAPYNPEKLPFQSSALHLHQPLDLFKTYTMIGGMPEVIATYKTEDSLTRLLPVYDALITSYLDDVEKVCKKSDT